MIKEVINELKKYTAGKKNTEKTEISVLALNRLIFALGEQEDILDKTRAEIEQIVGERNLDDYDFCSGLICARNIIDKYKAESEIEDETKVD